MTNLQATVPNINTPVVGANGQINPIWWQFFVRLLSRTGGGMGVDSTAAMQSARDSQAESSSEAFVGRLLIDIALQAYVAGQASVSRYCQADAHEQVHSHGVHSDPELHALATPTSSGFMSAADKAKLDAIH